MSHTCLLSIHHNVKLLKLLTNPALLCSLKEVHIQKDARAYTCVQKQKHKGIDPLFFFFFQLVSKLVLVVIQSSKSDYMIRKWNVKAYIKIKFKFKKKKYSVRQEIWQPLFQEIATAKNKNIYFSIKKTRTLFLYII